MLDHMSLPVSDAERSRTFYDAALTPLGYTRQFNVDDAGGYTGSAYGPEPRKLVFWIGAAEQRRDPVTPQAGFHIAFTAPNRAAVDAFYEAGMAAGGTDNGPPGLRTQYHPYYYGAFVIDPDGHHVEAVCHKPE